VRRRHISVDVPARGQHGHAEGGSAPGHVPVPVLPVWIDGADGTLGPRRRYGQPPVHRALLHTGHQRRVHQEARRRHAPLHVRPGPAGRRWAVHVRARPPGPADVAHRQREHAADRGSTCRIGADGSGWSDVRQPAPGPAVAARYRACDDERRRSVGRLQPSPKTRTRDLRRRVPWNAVWRTGANAATQLSTSADLVIGGATVPAGKYTLWTLPTPSGWKLIINKQTGQWGTEYSAAQDLVRVDARLETLAAPVEQMLIAFEPGTLTVSWDKTKVSVPVSRK